MKFIFLFSGIPTLSKKRKAQEDDNDIDNFNSDEFLYANSLSKNKEPRLSLGVENLTVFQTPRLKKSSQWGNLEDVIDNDKNDPTDKNKSDFDKEMTKTNIVGSIAKISTEEIKVNQIEKEIKTNQIETEITTNQIEKEIQNQIEKEINQIEITNDDFDHTDEVKITSTSKKEETPPEEQVVLTNGDHNEVEVITNGFTDEVEITANGIEDVNVEDEPEPAEMTSLTFIVGNESNEDTKDTLEYCLKNTSESIFNNENPISLNFKLYDTNVSDDIKVSRHSLGSLERPKSDVLKNVNKLKKLQSLIQSDLGGVSNVQVNTDEGKLLPQIDAPKNNVHFITTNATIDPDDTSKELYTTAIDTSLDPSINSETEDAKLELLINKSDDSSFVTEIEVSSSPDVTINTNGVDSPKKLSEMKFTTTTYENSTSRPQSQIEMLRSNFEKKTNVSPTKSKIPVALSPKTNSPTKSELDLSSGDDEKEIIEIMAKSIHSTPAVKAVKNPLVKNLNNKNNVTVTSIRTSSKIPSGQHFGNSTGNNLPTRPPVPPRRTEETESMFQQWVFTQPPVNEGKKN